MLDMVGKERFLKHGDETKVSIENKAEDEDIEELLEKQFALVKHIKQLNA